MKDPSKNMVDQKPFVSVLRLRSPKPTSRKDATRKLLTFLIALGAVATATLTAPPKASAGSMSLLGVGSPPQPAACPQATTFLARTSGLSGTETSAYTTMICGMVTDGTWSLLDGLWVFATNTITTANLNLVSTSFTLSKTGTVTFTADTGYTGDGSTGFFNTGYTPSSSMFEERAEKAADPISRQHYREMAIHYRSLAVEHQEVARTLARAPASSIG